MSLQARLNRFHYPNSRIYVYNVYIWCVCVCVNSSTAGWLLSENHRYRNNNILVFYYRLEDDYSKTKKSSEADFRRRYARFNNHFRKEVLF